MSEHILAPVEQIKYPGGKNGMWQVRCSCGRSFGPCAYPGHAEKRASDHTKAKEAK